MIIFSVLWFTFAYLPISHMVWYWDGPDAYTDAKAAEIANSHAGFLFQKGAIDFAGGTVVHINAGIAALIAALMLGPRKGYGKVAMAPHSLMMTAIGTGLLWMGWFGFNAVRHWKQVARQVWHSSTPCSYCSSRRYLDSC